MNLYAINWVTEVIFFDNSIFITLRIVKKKNVYKDILAGSSEGEKLDYILSFTYTQIVLKKNSFFVTFQDQYQSFVLKIFIGISDGMP